MVFSSVTSFVDHHNWHQQLQQSNPQGNCGGGETTSFQSPLVPPQHGGTGDDGQGSIRPGSMVDRARLAKLPMPEPGLNCPRCDSTNTKFCYFNNYSLTQPRHFCKACRRYWTRGGALRSVPVGGGCRRNKRSNKRRHSKSPSQNEANNTSISESPSRCSNENITTSSQLSHPPSLQFPFMSSYGGVVASNITPNLGVFPPSNEMGSFQLGTTSSLNGNNFSNILSIGSGESWRLPFLAGFEVPNNNNNTNLFHYQNEGAAVETAPASSIVENSQADDPDPVKAEENHGLNLSRQVINMGINSENNSNQQAWQVGNNWVGFPSSVNTTTTNFI